MAAQRAKLYEVMVREREAGNYVIAELLVQEGVLVHMVAAGAVDIHLLE